MSPPDFNNNSKEKLNKKYNEDGYVPALDTSVNRQDTLTNQPNSNLQNTDDKSKNLESTDKSFPDGIMMTNGKVTMMKKGKMSIIEKEIIMSNGTKVMRNGTVMKRDGSITIMKDGEHMDMNGKLIPLPGSKTPK